MFPKNLKLIRHAEAEGNKAERTFSNSGDDSYYSRELLEKPLDEWQLTSEGRSQAVNAGCWLREDLSGDDNEPLLLTSSALRAVDTAKLLLPEGQWQVHELLRERDFGKFSHLPHELQDRLDGQKKPRVDLNCFEGEDDDVEPMQSVLVRAQALMTYLRNCDRTTVVMVTHGYVIHAFRLILEQIDPCHFSSLVKDRWLRYCQVCHFTRQNPLNQNDVRNELSWLRETCLWVNNTIDTPWREIVS